MKNEAEDNTNQEDGKAADSGDEQAGRPTRKTSKKVVSRVRDATGRGGKESGESGAEAQDQAPSRNRREPEGEIETIVEEGSGHENRGKHSREERRRPSRGRRSGNKPQQQTRSEPVDPEELAKRAWKIYQSDVAEEGIALIDNSTGRQLAVRSFELARVFLEEKSRQKRLVASASSGDSGRGEARRDDSARNDPGHEDSERDDAQDDDSDDS